MQLHTFIRSTIAAAAALRGRVLLPLVAVLIACVLGCANGVRASQPSNGSSTSFRDVLPGAEIRAAKLTNAREAIESLRPWFLGKRGSNASVPVYVDGNRYDDFGDLNGIISETIVEIRHLTAAQAMFRFRVGHPAGAILITTRAITGLRESIYYYASLSPGASRFRVHAVNADDLHGEPAAGLRLYGPSSPLWQRRWNLPINVITADSGRLLEWV